MELIALQDPQTTDSRRHARVLALYRENGRAIFGYALGMVGQKADAEDVVQDAFLRLEQHLAARPDGDDPNLRGWLYRVTTNLCRDLHRKRQRRSELRAEQPVAAGGADGLSALALERVLGRLKPRERALVLMRGEGLSYAEMAAAADLRPSSVGQLLARAVRRFTTEYDREIGMEVDS